MKRLSDGVTCSQKTRNAVASFQILESFLSPIPIQYLSESRSGQNEVFVAILKILPKRG